MTLTGTVRTYDEPTRQQVKQRMQSLLDSVATGYGGKATLEYTSGCPAVINHTPLAKQMVQRIQQRDGQSAAILSDSPFGPSEDFAWYLKHAPGVYAFLGMGDTPMCHHPRYNFDDSVIGEGIGWWLAVAEARTDYPFVVTSE